jgi:hypothetical protein
MPSGKETQMTGRAGEYYVAAELNRRGANAVTFSGNMPTIDLLASDIDRNKVVKIQVKTRRTGSWHSSTDRFLQGKEENDLFWIFVDLGDNERHPRFWIVPWNWLLDEGKSAITAYLDKHGGIRPKNPDSKHYGITEKSIKQWQDRWDVLDIF